MPSGRSGGGGANSLMAGPWLLHKEPLHSQHATAITAGWSHATGAARSHDGPAVASASTALGRRAPRCCPRLLPRRYKERPGRAAGQAGLTPGRGTA
jgi:hypothetical protein